MLYSSENIRLNLLASFKAKWKELDFSGPFCLFIAVSGGADSMALLDTAYHFTDNLIALHVNHGLRGDQADEDEVFVKSFCDIRNITFFSIKEDVGKLAQENGISEELAGRKLRYSFFERMMDRHAIKKGIVPILLTGHHIGDQAESVLIHLFRGSGMAGVSAMNIWESRKSLECSLLENKSFDYYIFRPLLDISKEELKEYCKNREIEWREDPTNKSTDYTRNAIRELIIPTIEKEINPSVKLSLYRFSRIAQAEHKYINSEVKKIYDKYVFDGRGQDFDCIYKMEDHRLKILMRNAILLSSVSLDKRSIFEEDRAIIHNLIIRIMEEVGKKAIGEDRQLLSFSRINNIVDLAYLNVGKRIDLYDMIILSDFSAIHFIGQKKKNISIESPIKIPLEDIKKGSSMSFDWERPEGQILIRRMDQRVEKHKLVDPRFCYLSVGDLKSLEIRIGKGNDLLKKFGGKTSQLRKIYNEKKIPSILRETYPILSEGEKMIWVPMVVRSDHYPIMEGVPVIEVEWRSKWTRD